jgi:hypothetical protein
MREYLKKHLDLAEMMLKKNRGLTVKLTGQPALCAMLLYGNN